MRRRHLLALPLAVLFAVAGCGSSGDDGATTTTRPAKEPTVFAAASLTEAFEQLGGATLSFAGSQALVRQVQEGAPADVIATADEASMQALVDAHLVTTPRTFARNRLTIAVAPGNPKRVRKLADLGRADLAVVLAEPSVPAGRYAAEVLRRAGVTVRPASLELDVKAALTKVTSGEADAAVVYMTDVRAAHGKADAVAIPAARNVVASYPVALVRAGDRVAGRAFLRRLLGMAGQRALRAHGFLAAG